MYKSINLNAVQKFSAYYFVSFVGNSTSVSYYNPILFQVHERKKPLVNLAPYSITHPHFPQFLIMATSTNCATVVNMSTFFRWKSPPKPQIKFENWAILSSICGRFDLGRAELEKRRSWAQSPQILFENGHLYHPRAISWSNFSSSENRFPSLVRKRKSLKN